MLTGLDLVHRKNTEEASQPRKEHDDTNEEVNNWDSGDSEGIS
jgi:hypothetical protein